MQSAQIKAVRQILLAAKDAIPMDVMVRLWDGSAVNLGTDSDETIEIGINCADTIRELLLRPTLSTVFELYGLGKIYINGAPPSALLKVIDHVAIMRFLKTYGWLALLCKLAVFIRREKQAYQPSRGFFKTMPMLPKARNNQAMVRFHYDVSNDFYALFLDKEMVYSCGYFKTGNETLDTAQQAKIDLICRKLRLKKGDHLLDIGCGWGALICHAAQHYGVIAKGITLSQEQYDKGIKVIADRGLSDKVTITLMDYKDLDGTGTYDKIVQIGMFEHVGVASHENFFRKIHQLLRPRGTYFHHAITRRATVDISKFDRMTGYQKAITQFIFPGGELDHIGRTITNLERIGFEVHDNESLREHYKLTLEHWSQNLWHNREAAIALAGEQVVRLWLLYFALFIVGFDRNTVNIYQTVATKRRIGASGLPLNREDFYKSC
jgi:cyclopropane-fatty-acyl-phospholipid synthase